MIVSNALVDASRPQRLLHPARAISTGLKIACLRSSVGVIVHIPLFGEVLDKRCHIEFDGATIGILKHASLAQFPSKIGFELGAGCRIPADIGQCEIAQTGRVKRSATRALCATG